MAAELLGGPAPALAQTVLPSQVTPPNLMPAAGTTTSVFEIASAAALTPPAGAEHAALTLGQAKITGGLAALAREHEAVVKVLSRRRVSVAKIFEQAAALERAYAKAGYPLVRVSIPHQRLVPGGAVEIAINDGTFERVDVEGVPEKVRQFALAHTQRLVGRHFLKLADIERATLLAGDAAGLRMTSTLVRGASPNGVVLKLEGEHRLVSGMISADNHLSNSLGMAESTAQASFNSAFGYGEQIYSSVTLGLGNGADTGLGLPLMTLGLGASLPLGTDGFTLNPEVIYSKTRPKPESPAVPASEGVLERFALRGNYDLVRRHALDVKITGGVESLMQRSTATALDKDLTLDFYRSASLGLAVQGALNPSLTYSASGVVTQGLGGRSQSDVSGTAATLSRAGASPWFEKLVLQGRLQQELPDQFALTLIAQGQLAFGKPLFTSEQLSLDGADGVSGLSPGGGGVDTGAVLRAELARSFSFPAGPQSGVATPYIFAAAGLGELFNAQVGEQEFPWAYAYGAGLRATFDMPHAGTSFGLSLELAQARSNLPGAETESRASISGTFRF